MASDLQSKFSPGQSLSKDLPAWANEWRGTLTAIGDKGGLGIRISMDLLFQD